MIIPETPQRKWTSSILEVRTSWIFSSCSRCSRLRTVRKGTRSGGLRTGRSPFELLGSLSGFRSLRCQSLRHCVESCLEHEVSSPVLTWIVGYFWCFPRGVIPRLEWGHARALSSRAVTTLSCLPARRSWYLWLSHEAFPGGFPTGLSHMSPWCESMLGVKLEAVQGNQVPLEWTEISGGLWEWWHDAAVPLAFPVWSAST